MTPQGIGQHGDSVAARIGAVCSDRGLIPLGSRVTTYRPMTLVDLGRRLAGVDDAKTRWKLVWEFLEEYRWEPDDVQPSLLGDEPPTTGDERWDVLLAALAEHLAAQHDLAAPEWTELRRNGGVGRRRPCLAP